MSLNWKIREMLESDHPLVADSFLRSLSAELPAGACWKCLRRELERHLRDPNTVCLVAVSEDNDDQIFGWAILTVKPVSIYYVYVRESFRRKGIASALLGMEMASELPVTNLTEKGHAFLRALEQKRGLRFVYHR